MDLDVNKWLFIPGGGGVIALVLWRFLSKTRLGVTTDEAQGEGVNSILKLSKESMTARTEADQRARASHDLYLAEQDLRLSLERKVTTLEGQVDRLTNQQQEMRKLVSQLATLLVERDPAAKPFVQQWISDSGYPPLGSV